MYVKDWKKRKEGRKKEVSDSGSSLHCPVTCLWVTRCCIMDWSGHCATFKHDQSLRVQRCALFCGRQLVPHFASANRPYGEERSSMCLRPSTGSGMNSRYMTATVGIRANTVTTGRPPQSLPIKPSARVLPIKQQWPLI